MQRLLTPWTCVDNGVKYKEESNTAMIEGTTPAKDGKLKWFRIHEVKAAPITNHQNEIMKQLVNEKFFP